MHSQSMWRAVHASVLSARGEPADAELFAREAVAFAERTDDTSTIADAHVVLGGVLAIRGNTEAAQAELSRGLELYERKGNVVGADRVRAQLAPLARV
jgi:ATP/maltotriose-dependent transcriptional regulator MalT